MQLPLQRRWCVKSLHIYTYTANTGYSNFHTHTHPHIWNTMCFEVLRNYSGAKWHCNDVINDIIIILCSNELQKNDCGYKIINWCKLLVANRRTMCEGCTTATTNTLRFSVAYYNNNICQGTQISSIRSAHLRFGPIVACHLVWHFLNRIVPVSRIGTCYVLGNEPKTR